MFLRHYRTAPVGFVLVAAIACSKSPQQYLDSGNTYFARAEYKQAIVQFRNAIQRDPKFGRAYARLADAYIADGDRPNAFRESVRAADLLIDDAAAQITAAEFLVMAGRFEDAKARAERALALQPKSVEAQLVRGHALAGLKDLDGAIADVENAISFDPNRSGTYGTLGTLHLVQGDRTQAEAAFRKAIAMDPQSARARLDLATFYWSSGELTAAEQSIRDALQIAPADILTNRAAAYFYISTNRTADAEPFLKHVAEVTHEPRARLALADYYVTANRPNEALDVLQGLTADKSIASTAGVRIAAIEFAQGRQAEGQKRLDNILAREPKNVLALVEKGHMLEAQHKLDEGKAQAKAAIAVDSRSTRAHLLLGRLYVTTRDPNAAIAEFTEVLNLNPAVTAAKVALATVHLSLGNADLAAQYAEQAAKDVPGDASVRLLLARALVAKKDFATAESTLNELVKASPASAAAYSQLATVFFAQGRIREGRDALNRSLHLDPNDVEAIAAQVALALHDNDRPAARQTIERALVAQPKSTALLAIAANTYRALGAASEEERSLRAVIDLDPTNEPAYMHLVQLYGGQHRLDAARTELEALLQHQPRSVAGLTLLAMILEAQQHPDDARKRYETVLAIDPRAPVAANNLAWMYAETGGDLDIALQLAQTAKSLLPDEANVNDTLGWIYCKKGLATMAIPFLKDSLRTQPGNATFLLHLAVAYAKAGDRVNAKATLDKAVKADPHMSGNREARQLLAQLKG